MAFKIPNPFVEPYTTLQAYNTSCAFPFILIWPLLNCAFRFALKGLLPSAAFVALFFWCGTQRVGNTPQHFGTHAFH